MHNHSATGIDSGPDSGEPMEPAATSASPEYYLKTELYQLLQQDARIFEFLQAGSLDGLWYWDLEHIEQEWLSPRFKAIFGFEDHEVPNTSAWWQERIFREDLPIALDNFARHCADPNHPYDHVVRYLHRDGSTVWVRCRGMAIRDDGRPVRLLGAHTDVSVFKRAEEQLRAAEKKYHDLYDNSPDMYLSADAATGVITECNQTMTLLTGFTREEALGRTIAQFFSDDCAGTVAELLAGAAAGNDRGGAELTMRRRGHNTMPVQLTVHAVRNAAAQPVEYRISCRDMRQARHMEKLDLFLQVAPVAVVMTDQAGKIVLVNGQTEKLFGFGPGELPGQPVERLLPEGWAEPDVAARPPFQSPDRPQNVTRELCARRKDGSRLPIEISLSQVSTNAGGRIIACIVDITQRRRAEEMRMEAERANSRLAAIVEFSRDAMIGMDMNGTVTTWNAGAERLFGYAREEMTGAEIFVLTPPDRIQEQREIPESIRLGVPIEYLETRYLTKSGESIDVSVTVSPIRDAAGKVIGASQVARDISKRKRAEAELARRTEELGRSNRDLEQFAYVASHDLNEPLRAVAGSLELLNRRYAGRLDEKASEYISHAIGGAGRMQKLIADLLEFSRVGSRGGDFSHIAAQSSLDNAMDNLRSAIRETHALITADPLPKLNADPSQMALLFQNLLGNAIKFRGPNPPRIHVSAHREPSQWVLSVRDSGLGIPPKYFERIFDIFQRLHTRQEYPGTGIGLAICKRIMERHGGRIWVESVPGERTTFYCAFPARTEDEDEAQDQPEDGNP